MSDTYFIKINGTANIPETLEMGKNYRISTEGSVTQKKEDDNFDGSSNVTFKFEPINVSITDKLGKTIKAADPRRNSQKIRAYLFKIYADEGLVEAFDDVYDAATIEICSLMPQILRSAIKRIENK